MKQTFTVLMLPLFFLCVACSHNANQEAVQDFFEVSNQHFAIYNECLQAKAQSYPRMKAHFEASALEKETNTNLLSAREEGELSKFYVDVEQCRSAFRSDMAASSFSTSAPVNFERYFSSSFEANKKLKMREISWGDYHALRRANKMALIENVDWAFQSNMDTAYQKDIADYERWAEANQRFVENMQRMGTAGAGNTSEASNTSVTRTSCLLNGEATSGLNRVCTYNCTGSTYTKNVSSALQCPLTATF